MELRHIRYFIAVAEECHFGRAAERLHIAQPPLSQQIKQLEAELGVQLLTRSTRRVELTQAGERYLERARAIVAAVDDAGKEAVRVAAGEVGRVSLGFVGTATYELLPRLARAVREDFPGIELDLHGEMLTPDQVAALHAGTLDLAFLRPPVRDADLKLKVLRREPLVVALAQTHPLASLAEVPLGALQWEPFITYPSQHRSVTYDAVFDACLAAGFEPQVRQEVAETSTMVSFVAAGTGVAVVPASVQHLRISGAVYRPLEGSPAEVELAVAKRARDDSRTSPGSWRAPRRCWRRRCRRCRRRRSGCRQVSRKSPLTPDGEVQRRSRATDTGSWDRRQRAPAVPYPEAHRAGAYRRAHGIPASPWRWQEWRSAPSSCSTART